MSDAGAEGWEHLHQIVLAHVSGELTAAVARAHAAALAERCGLADDVGVSRLLRGLEAREKAHQLRRESFHRLNNAIAGVRANLDFLSLALEGEKATAPFLEHATPEQRASVLQALRYALESSERMVAVTHAALDGGAP